MLSTVLSRLALSAVPGVGPLAYVLLPALAYVVTQRKVEINLSAS